MAFMISVSSVRVSRHERLAPAIRRRKLTALVQRLAELHPPEDLAPLRVAQVTVEAVAQTFVVEHFARLRWKRGVCVVCAVLAGLFGIAREKVNFCTTARDGGSLRTIWKSPRMKLLTCNTSA